MLHTQRDVRVGIASRRSPLRRGAPVEASAQQRRRQRCEEQWHSNGSGKGILATTAWHSLIAASLAFFLPFLIYFDIAIEKYRTYLIESFHQTSTIKSSHPVPHKILSLSLSFLYV